MGEQAKQIVGIDIEELIADLNRAYADEWLAYYLYQFMANSVSGNLADSFKDNLEEIAKAEYEHASELAAHIIKLGGKPIDNPMDLEAEANNEYITPPDDMSDIPTIIDAVLKSEAGAIEVYQDLAQKTFGKDMVTHALITHILAEETDHEELFYNLK